MLSYLRFPDDSVYALEDIDVRDSNETYMAKVDVWGVAYNGKRWKTTGGVFEAWPEQGIVFVMDMEEKK